MGLRALLSEPRLATIDLNGPDRIRVHRSILHEKLMIRQVFEEIYRTCLQLELEHLSREPGMRVEIGAGTSFLKSLSPDVLATDLAPDPQLEAVVDAQAMPFDDGSVRTLFCINAFHHFGEPRRFFAEAMRVLQPGGGCVIVDPAYGALANAVYRRLFSIEGYDRSSPDWNYVHDRSRGTVPNQALSYIVFIRDAQRFSSEFPGLEIVEKKVFTNYVRYLLSGGLNFRQLVPNWAIRPLRLVELLLSSARRTLGLHHVVVIRKRPGTS